MNYVKPYVCASRHHTATGKCHETVKSSCQTHEKHWCGVVWAGSGMLYA